jgi:hypothetical protein
MRNADQIAEIVRNVFGLSASTLFSAIDAHDPLLSLQEKKRAFCSVIHQLLSAGRIKFIAPGADCYVSSANPHPKLTIQDNEAHWHASPEEIVASLSAKWPVNVHDENDPDLTVYFYSIPAIIWIGDDGLLVSS